MTDTTPTTQDRLADLLDRAQRCFEETLNPDAEERAATVVSFIYHVTTAVLLEHLRRVDPDMAETLGPWLLDEDGIFCDGYAGELLHGWREQLAAGLPLSPIGPGGNDVH